MSCTDTGAGLQMPVCIRSILLMLHDDKVPGVSPNLFAIPILFYYCRGAGM